MQKRLNALPLLDGKARVCCLGCGQNLVVPAGHEDHALGEMRHHARQDHGHELSPDLRSASRNDEATDDLVVTFTCALPREAFLN